MSIMRMAKRRLAQGGGLPTRRPGVRDPLTRTKPTSRGPGARTPLARAKKLARYANSPKGRSTLGRVTRSLSSGKRHTRSRKGPMRWINSLARL
ncbi:MULTISPECIES: hypothetical protein [Nocardiopsis]|uniref:Uncharacterized protein n=1 Tax=Nocardiopsis sinuspersici TaxID=501010 RepID=A0A7Z0BKI4_9ACTN|nr:MULTISPECIES: hypothetical protein [Nocardiopsis]NYH54888.1 hypothetical protein [Nocardiopsis sinuspersici]